MPAMSTIFRWLESNPQFREEYARARETQCEVLAAEIIDIADDGTRDMRVDSEGKEIVDHDHIARSRLRVDARKWYLSKVLPKKWGEKLNLEATGADGGPIKNTVEVVFVSAKKEPAE